MRACYGNTFVSRGGSHQNGSLPFYLWGLPDIKYPKETLTRGLTTEVSFWAWPQRQKKESQANKMLTAL